MKNMGTVEDDYVTKIIKKEIRRRKKKKKGMFNIIIAQIFIHCFLL